MTKQGTILVVDDNKGILTAVQMLLGTCFEKVITISTPNKIKATLHDENIDVVLLDMNFRKVCQNSHLLFYAQSPDFHKLGLCYNLKILYL